MLTSPLGAVEGSSANSTITRWARQLLRDEPPRTTSLVVTVFGDAIAPHGGAAWLRTLIDLMDTFGINERAVRTSVYRLAEDAWLQAERQGRQSRYALTEAGRRRFALASRRIYHPGSPTWDGQWTLVLIPRGAEVMASRTDLRRDLAWEGFATITPGLLAHPQADAERLRELLEELGVRDDAFVVRAQDLPGVTERELSELAGYWPLDAVAMQYEDFVSRFAPVAEAVETRSGFSPRQAFLVRTLLVHWYRRVVLHDPRLPAAMLPPDWPGGPAYALSRRVYRAVTPGAEAYLTEALGKDGVPVSAEFRARFTEFA
ncbi:MAG TPA: phenylacetic acid degradation operon negative regulatory protein PaaX [Gemmatimonas sp.]|uniref:phenylacetic acid degradation operon negative regulatory protein PaaX n=1 Tax=Gemmatimonas sp. TaxID=1962908 RepID=UPI002EDB651C